MSQSRVFRTLREASDEQELKSSTQPESSLSARSAPSVGRRTSGAGADCHADGGNAPMDATIQ